MSIGNRWVIECDASECQSTLGIFILERDAIEHAKYGDHGWAVSEKEWLFGMHLLTYCPKHAPAFDTESLGEYSSNVLRLLS